MKTLTRDDLMSLEQYHTARKEFKAEVLEHKKPRRISLGDNARLYFEDRLTIQYQIQEMLRIEKIFESDGIQEELDAYNPLIPDGGNLKATFMVEFDDPEERRKALARMVGLEDTVWLQVEGFDKVMAISNEDLERSTEEKTSAVHFMRFEFSEDMRKAMKDGAALHAGIDHPEYTVSTTAPDDTRAALARDFD